MSRKPGTDPFQQKMSRNDRFAQMSNQERIIEEKKKEILAKLEAKKTVNNTLAPENKNLSSKQSNASQESKASTPNIFNNDGSFLTAFKNIKDKTRNSKRKSFKSKDSSDKSYGDDRKKWLSQKQRSTSPKHNKVSSHRFNLEKSPFEQKITINTSFNNSVNQQNFDYEVSHPHILKRSLHQHNFLQHQTLPPQLPLQQLQQQTLQSLQQPHLQVHQHIQPSLQQQTLQQDTLQHALEAQQITVIPQHVTGQPLLKNLIETTSEISYTSVAGTGDLQVITTHTQPIVLNMSPQVVQGQISSSVVIPSQIGSVIVSTSDVTLPANVLSTVSLPPNSLISNQINVGQGGATIATVELSNIPPPNPIQVHNIPQPEPMNTLTIPQPAPLQVRNIPTPASMQLNEIPNPKPLDLLAIPTPNDDSLDPGFIKSIPPPNKSIPPPNLEAGLNLPRPLSANCVSILQSPQNLPNSSSILVHTIQPIQSVASTQIQLQTITNTVAPPPNLQTNFTPVISVSLPGIVSSPMNVTNTIPSLMAHPILPPPGMGLTSLASPVNVNCPPPLLAMNNTQSLQGQLSNPSFVNQPPPVMSHQMPRMNLPPPPTPNQMTSLNTLPHLTTGLGFRDTNAVFPPGTSDYEAMVSLARMVAQCGPSIQDEVRQRKTQDPSLWFLYQKDSAAYRQYQQLVEQFTREISAERDVDMRQDTYKPEDIYEPESAAFEDENSNSGNYSQDHGDAFSQGKRKRKSRWGNKETNIPAPVVIPPIINMSPILPMPQHSGGGQVMLSKVSRADPALVQYAIQTFGSSNLTEEEWKKAEDHYKINLLYQDMVKRREEVERLNMAGKNKYEYDSDEDTEGGTWEHKIREKEMTATEMWATELNRQAEGKHHIGDFLPPEEFKRFMEKSTAVKEGHELSFSDYKEFKIKEDNIGFKMLQKLGWTEGEGLGSSGGGIVEPVNKGPAMTSNQGLGLKEDDPNDDEYESYRKRMMLAYRFRPNPLNNPRRSYY